ncbi:MAG TPA: hypothetical protein VI935_03620 [Thermodesulfobacteriota bacterium]|nr:hypothetical protein [Thermodesulfobacteriota bacterium]
MNFREDYGDYSAQEAVDAILVILKQNGVKIDENSFTWTLVGALFDKGILSRQEFERIYFLLKSQTKESGNSSERNI